MLNEEERRELLKMAEEAETEELLYFSQVFGTYAESKVKDVGNDVALMMDKERRQKK